MRNKRNHTEEKLAANTKKTSTALTKHSSLKNIFLLCVKKAYQIHIWSHRDFINHNFKFTFTIGILPSRTAVPLLLVYESISTHMCTTVRVIHNISFKVMLPCHLNQSYFRGEGLFQRSTHL